MERLSVYEDYVQTMAFLRASRNRVFNALETSNVSNGVTCRTLCHDIYERHALAGFQVVLQLRDSMACKNYAQSAELAGALHRHNRVTARISRLFEEDVSDTHADDDNIQKEIKPEQIVVQTGKFIEKLQTFFNNL